MFGFCVLGRLSDFGSARFFRPYNDARFHHRPPIKEQLGIAIGYGGAGGFYVELSLDGLLVGGRHAPPVDRPARAIPRGDRRRPPRRGFDRALRSAPTRACELVEPVLKRAPRGYPLDHPRIEHLRRKNLTVFARHELEPWLHEPAAASACARSSAPARSSPGSASTSGRRSPARARRSAATRRRRYLTGG